jgi:hypothetical protein
MIGSTRNRKRYRAIWPASAVAALLLVASCGYRFTGGPGENPYPPELKTIVVESAVNNATVTGIEAELTNDLRQEFALGTRLTPVRSGGDVVLKTNITAYEDTPSTYRADGKELTRIGTLRVACLLERSDSKKVLWRQEFAQAYPYNVTDNISSTLGNRRQAISRMIKDLIPRIHRSMYDNF